LPELKSVLIGNRFSRRESCRLFHAVEETDDVLKQGLGSFVVHPVVAHKIEFPRRFPIVVHEGRRKHKTVLVLYVFAEVPLVGLFLGKKQVIVELDRLVRVFEPFARAYIVLALALTKSCLLFLFGCLWLFREELVDPAASSPQMVYCQDELGHLHLSLFFELRNAFFDLQVLLLGRRGGVHARQPVLPVAQLL